MRHKAYAATMQSVWFSEDEGESWNEIVRHMPTILSVEVMPAAT